MTSFSFSVLTSKGGDAILDLLDTHENLMPLLCFQMNKVRGFRKRNGASAAISGRCEIIIFRRKKK